MMAQLLMVIVDDLKALPKLLSAWRQAGVPGVTIVPTAGAYRTVTWLSRVGLGALDRLFEADEVRQRTLLTVIEDDDLLQIAIAEAERVIGDFNQPNTGLLAVIPLMQVKGLQKTKQSASHETLPPAVRPDWIVQRDTPVHVIVDIMNLEPTIVQASATLDEVALAMQAHPSVHVACVVNQEDQLVGLLPLRSLADDLFFHIMPEEFISEASNFQRAIEYADKSRLRTAADAMQPPAWVKPDERVSEAFRRMHDRQLPGLPVVDDRYHVVGYINLLELLAACFQNLAVADQETSSA
jgi:CBS domain-containing protein